MKNRIIPEAEIKMVESVLKQVDSLMELHHSLSPNVSDVDNVLERVHSVLFIELLKDFVHSACMLRYMMEISEEELISHVTDNGKIPFEIAEMNILLSALEKVKKDI